MLNSASEAPVEFVHYVSNSRLKESPEISRHGAKKPAVMMRKRSGEGQTAKSVSTLSHANRASARSATRAVMKWPREPAPSAQSVGCSQTPRLNLPLGRRPPTSSLTASQRRWCASLRPISIATFVSCSLAPRDLAVVCAGGCEVRLRDDNGPHRGQEHMGTDLFAILGRRCRLRC